MNLNKGVFWLLYLTLFLVLRVLPKLRLFPFSDILKASQKTFARSKKYIAEYTRNPRGLILRIGDRKSPNFFRIYQQKNGIRFELEIKNQPLKAVQDSLFMNHIKDFEHQYLKRNIY